MRTASPIRQLRGVAGVAAIGVLVASCGAATDATMPDTSRPVVTPIATVTTVTIAGRPLLAVGDTATFLATPLDRAGAPLSAHAVAWTTAAADVATVDAKSGLLQGVGVGSTVVTATVDGKSANVTVNVAARGTDVTPPQLLSLVYAPDTIDLMTTHDIVVSGRVTDVGSGTQSFDIEFRGPTNASIECRARAPSSGTVLDGTWSCTITVASGAARGPWTVEAVELHDANGNVRDVEVNELAARGFPTVITIH